MNGNARANYLLNKYGSAAEEEIDDFNDYNES